MLVFCEKCYCYEHDYAINNSYHRGISGKFVCSSCLMVQDVCKKVSADMKSNEKVAMLSVKTDPEEELKYKEDMKRKKVLAFGSGMGVGISNVDGRLAKICDVMKRSSQGKISQAQAIADLEKIAKRDLELRGKK